MSGKSGQRPIQRSESVGRRATGTIALLLILAIALVLSEAYAQTALSAREFVENVLQVAAEQSPRRTE